MCTTQPSYNICVCVCIYIYGTLVFHNRHGGQNISYTECIKNINHFLNCPLCSASELYQMVMVT